MKLKAIDSPLLDPNYRYYSMVIVDIGQLRMDFHRRWDGIQRTYLLCDLQYEALFDWCVLQAFHCTRLKSVGSFVLHHYDHDIFTLIYEELAYDWQLYFQTTSTMRNVVIRPQRPVKVLVAGCNMIIAQEGTFT